MPCSFEIIKWSNSHATEDNKCHMQACALSLLETCVFHVDVAEAVADTGPDLVDYCVRWGFLKPSFLKSS